MTQIKIDVETKVKDGLQISISGRQYQLEWLNDTRASFEFNAGLLLCNPTNFIDTLEVKLAFGQLQSKNNASILLVKEPLLMTPM